jgi:AhpD family alkylhydroperoxidase
MDYRAGVARIPPVLAPTPEQQELLAKTIRNEDGSTLGLFSTLLHHPLLLRRVTALGDTFLGSGSLPPRERELAILRVAAREGSAYEWGHHVRLGREAGVREDELAALARVLDAPHAAWSRGDREVLGFVDELLTAGEVSDTTWDALLQRYTKPQLLELTAMIGFYRMLAGVLRVAGVAADAGLPAPPSEQLGRAWR